MKNPFSSIKQIVSRPFRRAAPTGSEAPPGRRRDPEGRSANIARQIEALQHEIHELKVGMELDGDLGEDASSFDVRRRLIRARDLRYKAALLGEELRRIRARSGLLEEEVAQPAGPEDAPRGIQEVIRQVMDAASFSTRSQRTIFEKALDDLAGPYPDTRLKAVRMLRDLLLPVSAPLFRAGLGFENDTLRAECIQALAELKEPCADQVIEECLESPSHRLRLAALRSMYNTQSPGTARACVRCLADSHPEIRRSAASFLGLTKAAETAPALAVLLRDEDVDVRVAAAQALGSLCSEQSVHMLIRTLEDEEASVRAAAKAALSQTLSAPLDIDVERRPEILGRKVDALLKWWTTVRAKGPPWSVHILKSLKDRLEAPGDSLAAEERKRALTGEKR